MTKRPIVTASSEEMVSIIDESDGYQIVCSGRLWMRRYEIGSAVWDEVADAMENDEGLDAVVEQVRRHATSIAKAAMAGRK